MLAQPFQRLPDQRLDELVQKIKPVVRFSIKITQDKKELVTDEEGVLYFIKKVDPREMAFTWDPKPTRVADELNSTPYKVIETYHSYMTAAIFRATAEEVLVQIPNEDLERCVAFETVYRRIAKNSSDHIAETRLYERLPERAKK